MLLQCLPSNFDSVRLTVLEEMSFNEFQDGRYGGHLGYRNGTTLAILNFYIAPMPSIKFRLNPTYGLRGDHLKNFKMSVVAAILDIRTERF